MSSAEAIAKVISDLRAGRVGATVSSAELRTALRGTVGSGPVVDVTAIFRTKVLDVREYNFYEDHPCITPPWPSSILAWENTHGNVYVISMIAVEETPPESHRWETAEPLDWERDVRWVVDAVLWTGGRRGDGRSVRTAGPLYLWQFAIGRQGEPLDLHWVDLYAEDYPEESAEMTKAWVYENALLTILRSLTFLNCANIEAVEPRRERHERRRLERIGVKVQTLVVLPVGRRYAGRRHTVGVEGTALTSVRGHFARYGPEYGTGLLFGKYAGRFWIPAHARGTPEIGVNVNDYELRP